MENATNITNSSKGDNGRSYFSNYILLMRWTVGMETVYTIVGTMLNLWLLLSILTSRDLRVRMRNQLIVNLCIVHLVQTLIKGPLQILKSLNILYRLVMTWEFFCHTYSIIMNVDYAQSLLADWLMVFLVGIFIANILDLDVSSKWTPQVSLLSKAVMHLFPWIVAIIITPVAIHQASRGFLCLFVPYNKLFVFETAYTLIPLGITVLLIIVAVVLRYRRFSRGSSTSGANMAVILIGKGPEIDNVFAYILASAICIACEICHLIIAFEFAGRKYRGMAFRFASFLIGDSRVIFMVVPWLLLPDIRQRIRSWRPWQREPTGIDLTVTYGKESP